MTEPSAPIVLVSASDGPRLDTRVLARALDNQHKSVMSLLSDYEDEFKSLGLLSFQTAEIQGRGQPQKYALLNEDQCYLMLTMARNTGTVVQLKVQLVQAFAQARRGVTAPALAPGTDPILAQLQALTQVRQEQLAMRSELDALQHELAHVPIHSAQIRTISKLGKQLGKLMGYRKAWGLFYDRFELASYRDLPRTRFDEACSFLQLQIEAWQGRPLLDHKENV